MGEKDVKDWVVERLASLHAYDLKRKRHVHKKEGGILNRH